MAHERSQLLAPTSKYLARLKALRPDDVVRLDTGMHYGEESKYVTVRFDPRKYSTIELLALTDVQFGHLYCNEDKFDEYLRWLLSEKNRFVLFLGDMIDAATAISIASPYENTVEPQGQVFRFVEKAMPIRHRILGYCGGNHERRGVKTFGDLGRLIATLLEVPYSAGKQFIDVHYGEHTPFRNSIWHGRGASITKGAKAQMLHRFMGQGDSQAYWVGHLHDGIILFDWREKRERGRIKLEKIVGTMSTSFLEHYGTYAEVAGLPGSDTMMTRVVLYPTGKWELTAR